MRRGNTWFTHVETVKESIKNYPNRYVFSMLLVLVLILVCGGLTACGDRQKIEDRRAEMLADIQAKLPADCYFQDLGPYKPNSYTTVYVAMVNCENRATRTMSTTTTGKQPRRVVAPFIEDLP